MTVNIKESADAMTKAVEELKKDTLPDLPGMKDLMETKIPEI